MQNHPEVGQTVTVTGTSTHDYKTITRTGVLTRRWPLRRTSAERINLDGVNVPLAAWSITDWKTED
jgi:hypothetical protein